ncbi:GDYXXLXY domain-containing protein [Anatilimnocola floriformis]|uniref:GDYXXLXY domain-containing protein n=1 Tax=Anatilimnocola floriformis TaxID=2948575 RepID=UPI0020C53066|nr:GDYXXLXY domain-containing protein [Anatilimnocola floriformis]
MVSKLVLIGLVAFGQISLLGGMIAIDSLPYRLGETVRLKVIPVDPRDMFRGDYSILGYDFTNLDRRKIVGLDKSDDYWRDAGREVFIVLEKSDGDLWTTKEVTTQRPSGGTYLQGTLNYGRVECGIEAYFVQEGRGRAIDDAVRAGKQVTAEVAVWQGKAKLKEVKISQ